MKERYIKLKNKYFYGVNEIYEDISDFIGNKSYNTFLLHSKQYIFSILSNPFPDQTCCRYFCMLFVLLLIYRSVCFVPGKTTYVTVLPQRPFACVWYQLGIGTQHRNIIIYIFHYDRINCCK